MGRLSSERGTNCSRTTGKETIRQRRMQAR
jgi:hypothetical protein